MIVTPIKIQGKKTKLIPDIQEIVQHLLDKNKNINTWVEPFLGSGAVAFNCSRDPQIKTVIVNDINPHIIKFYSKINDGEITGSVIRDVFKMHSKRLQAEGGEYYKLIKDRFNESKESLDFLFLTRTGFNGVMRFNKKGEWNVPFCKLNNRLTDGVIEDLANTVDELSRLFKSKTFIFYNKSYEDVIRLSPDNAIFYCDPPYYGLDVKYFTGWEKKNEVELFELIKGKTFIYSTWLNNGYKDNPMIDELWKDFNIYEKEHKYMLAENAGDRKKVIEGIIYPGDKISGLW